MKNLSLSFLLFLTFNAVARADIAVVVHPDNPISSISIEDTSKIFLSKTKAFGNGQKIILFDLEEGDDTRTDFYQKVTHKSASQIKSYWTRLIFTGKAKPPQMMTDSDEIIVAVGADINSIGYVELDAVDETVKVVLTISN